MADSKLRIEKFALGSGAARGVRGTIHVGLVNNMPDVAMRATELQFARLLKDASATLDVRLHLFSMAQIPRSEEAASRMEGFYADAATLPAAGLDALIVTGAEPRAGDMRREPYWDALTHLVDWAEIGTISTWFSCLAAHAAVLHLDNIERQPLAKKLSGVFAVEQLGDDTLLAGLPVLRQVPHSRRNQVTEDALSQKGYRILSRIAGGGADLFTRNGASLFVFAQGHPEYGAETLGREYLRDMGRFLRGEDACPAIPENYFDRMTENRLAELVAAALDEGDLPRLQEQVLTALPLMSWRGRTLRLFGNWLAIIAAEKMRRAARSPAHDHARKRA